MSLVAFVLMLVSAGLLVASAAAQPGDASGLPANSPVFNPQETNVPYLAWRGEEVRLVKCDTEFNDYLDSGAPTLQTDGGFFWGSDVSLQIFAYSGPQENSFDGPKAVQSSASIFYDRNTRRPCIRADFISNKAGIAIIKLTVSKKGVILGQHDFVVGWMAINSAAMTNAGSVTENPGAEPGNSVNVKVTGSIPLNSEFQADYGLPATLVMPNDWARWANAMASTDQNLGGLPASAYWDIHDSSGPLGNENPNGSPDVHVNQDSCPESTNDAYVDQVDNCAGGSDEYSRIFGDLTEGAFGPFDPSYDFTLLSDGRLNASDAPMPALKIVFNSKGGMGGFDDSCLNNKSDVYNRNFDPTNPPDCIKSGHDWDEAHALYAPYYGQFVPATSRDPWGAASGTDGPVYTNYTGQPNNFPGFGWYGLYYNWEIAQTLVQNESQDTNCLLTTRDYKPIYRQTNGFATSIIEFTDEHGEARAQWQPGLDNDNYGTTVGFVDDNGGCDLEGVNLGAQTITAAARYPFQPVAKDVAVTGTITKNINNLFRKTVSCVRKNNVSSAIAYICTATARDIAGNGDVFNGENVCFSREPDNVWYNVGGSYAHPNGYCVPLSGGTSTTPASVSVETPATLVGSLIDVQAYFAGEKLLRDTCIVAGAASSTAGPCRTGTTPTSPPKTGGGSSTPAKTLKASVVSVQVVMTAKGRVLMVKVRSSKASAKIRVRLLNRKGHVITNALRSIKTNKRVKVKNLRITKSVKTVRVQLVS
ncbi:MAG TPA: hypothetical protein VLU96_11695 [Gaiellaceae bacterium]|nr:hypothetical protein [Gaiellaceae bacterium]